MIHPEKIHENEISSATANDGEVGKKQIRDYTKEFFSVERKDLADSIREKRRDYFSGKKDTLDEMSALSDAIETGRENMGTLFSGMNELEEELQKKTESAISSLFNYFAVKRIESEISDIKDQRELGEKEIIELLAIRAELSAILSEKKKLKNHRKAISDFYNTHEKGFRDYSEKQRIIEIERLEKEETQRKVDVFMSENDCFFVHGIRHGWAPTVNSIVSKDTSFEAKLGLCLGLEPTMSTSAIRRGASSSNFWSHRGLLLTRGRVDAASDSDAATRATGLFSRTDGSAKKSVEEMKKCIIPRSSAYNSSGYNEFVVSSPGFAGMYLTADREKEDSVSDRDFFEIAKKYGLPTYYIENGNVYNVVYDEAHDRIVVAKDKLSPEKLAAHSKLFSEEEKEGMFDEIFRNEMPFRVNEIMHEARAFDARSSGWEQYIELIADKLSDSERGEHGGVADIYNSIGVSTRYVAEQGRLIRVRTYPGKGESCETINPKNFHISSYIHIGFNTWDLGISLRNIDSYLHGMNNAFEKIISEIRLYRSEGRLDQQLRLHYYDLINRLVFHAYGFSDAAKHFGDEMTHGRTLEIAEKAKSPEDYHAYLDRRLGKDGKFKVFFEDFKRKEQPE